MDQTSENEAEILKTLREAAGLDVAQLAAMANLSAGQVRQLEEGGDSHFYSPQIKAQSMRRVLRLLQNQPSAEEAAALATLEQVPKSVNVIDDIIRLSETNLKSTIDTSLVRRPPNPYKALLLVGAALVGVFMLLNWQANHTKPQNLFSEWIEPFTAKPVAEAAPAQDEPVAQAPLPVKPIEPETTVTESVPPGPVSPAAVPTPAATPMAVPTLADVKPSPAEQPKPTVKQSEPIAVSNSSSQVAGDCKLLTAEPMPASPVSVSKPGSYVYLLPNKDVQVCVDDGKRVQTVVNLKAGQGRSIHGSSPWVIGSNQISAVQVYFQGSKVMIPKDVGQRIVLKEQALQN
jgi:transcriptional regulator with XRE-family HTH domain